MSRSSTLARYSAAAAIFWPVSGVIILTCDAVIGEILHLPPITRDGIRWAQAGWGLWSLLAPAVVTVTLAFRRRYHGAKLVAAHCVTALAASATHSILYFTLRTLIAGQPGTAGESAIDAWMGGLHVTLELDILVYVLTVTGVHAALSLRTMKEQEKEAEELQRRIGRTELELLKMQIPERLLMTMFTHIETLVVSSLEQAETLIERLSRLLRSALGFSVAKRTLSEEVALARNFASAATSIRKTPFRFGVRVWDERSSALPATKLMLPLLVSIWSDIADDESPDVVIDIVERRVVWTIAGVRDASGLRSFAETVRVRLPPAESIFVRDTPDGLVITYARPAESVEEPAMSRPVDGGVSPVSAARPTPAIATLPAFLMLYPPVEAFAAGMITVGIAAANGVPAPDSAFAEVFPAAIATPAGLALAWISYQQRYRPQRAMILLALGIGAILGPVFCMALASAAIALFRPRSIVVFDVLREQIAASYRTDDFLIFFGIALGALAYGRQLASEERRFENQMLDEQLARMHAQALKDQLNPHFVFNALNSILALADRNRTAAAAMTARLREYFELVAGMAERHQVPLHEELRFTETYLDIEKVRFGERLNVSIDVEPAALTGLVPNLLLQPLIENAVRHGLEPMQGGSVFITAARERDELVIHVRDDGSGLRAAPRQQGIGMQNVRNRLRQLHGPAFTMDANSSPQGFSVAIRLPFRSSMGG